MKLLRLAAGRRSPEAASARNYATGSGARHSWVLLPLRDVPKELWPLASDRPVPEPGIRDHKRHLVFIPGKHLCYAAILRDMRFSDCIPL